MHDFDSESDLDLSGIVEDVDLITSVNEESNLIISEENSDKTAVKSKTTKRKPRATKTDTKTV